jgi:superfamily I DNA/RNA helicase
MMQLSFDKYLAEQAFKGSKYQQAIFNWVENGSGSCVVGAVPGSGKTTTLIQSSRRISGNLDSTFLAFNKHIVQELKTKLPPTMKTSTIHSLGFSSIKKIFPKTKVNGNKYQKLVKQYLIDRNIRHIDDINYLVDLVKFVQLTLADYSDLNQLKELCNYFSIPITSNWRFWQEAVGDILQQGMSETEYQISFDDMVWLPNVMELPINKADFLFVDEAQDLNQAQLQIVMRAYKRGTRGLFVGDSHQSIMQFTGADSQSISNIINTTNAIQLPLSISYRLPLSHVNLANEIYDVIEPAENAIEGIMDKIDSDDIPHYVKGGDLIICRCFYPIIPVYFNLIRHGIPAQIKNHDISGQLISLLNVVFVFGENLIMQLTCPQFSSCLAKYYQEKRNELIDSNNLRAIIILDDKIQTLNAIYEGNKCSSIADCIMAINQLCKPKGANPINLTTIHGAKGLEANQVFILKPDLLPHPLAKQDWEKEAERNLFFVALTRAKNALYFC